MSEKHLLSVESSYYIDPQLVMVQRIRDCEVLSPKWDTLLPKADGSLLKRWQKNGKRHRWQSTTKKQGFPDSRAVAYMNLQQLQQHAHDLLKLKPEKKLSMERKVEVKK